MVSVSGPDKLRLINRSFFERDSVVDGDSKEACGLSIIVAAVEAASEMLANA